MQTSLAAWIGVKIVYLSLECYFLTNDDGWKAGSTSRVCGWTPSVLLHAHFCSFSGNQIAKSLMRAKWVAVGIYINIFFLNMLLFNAIFSINFPTLLSTFRCMLVNKIFNIIFYQSSLYHSTISYNDFFRCQLNFTNYCQSFFVHFYTC